MNAEKYTQKTLEAIQTAQSMAQENHNNYLMPEHLLYALIDQDGGLILSDRYTTSNAVHQASKEPKERREAFFRWLYDLEFTRMGLPRPDLVLYLDMPISFTEQLMRGREAQTGTHADIHEQDLDYLRLCRETASQAAEFYGWTKISCVRDGKLRSIEEIHEELYRHIRNCLEG